MTEIDSEYWTRYYAVTVDRPAWDTVKLAIRLFAAEDAAAAGRPARGAPGADAASARFAVDLGCGAGRDARELLRAGWRVLAVDREQAAVDTLKSVTPPELRPALQTRVADLGSVEVPACDLVNASLSLPFLTPDLFWPAWRRVLDALPVGGRVAAKLFGDRDDSVTDPTMTCPSPADLRATLSSFEIEHWVDAEEDTTTALGEPHHFHMLEVVARRVS